MQVKSRSADFNGWQTAYAFDVLRGVLNAATTRDGAKEVTRASNDLRALVDTFRY
jgi:methyl-accepting chemotaxis protein